MARMPLIMKTAIIIPARYGSTRFPGKPLALIAGKRTELLKSLQSIYGISRADAEREIRGFEARNRDYRPK